MNKNLGQVFTPDWIVDIMLDSIHYNNQEILKKKIMEPSFGDGAFLSKIVERYINIANENSLSNVEIKEGLESYIYGIEIDTQYFNETIHRLNLIAAQFGIENVQWNLQNQDSLRNKDFYSEMDFVVGNPPYVRIHNIPNETRAYLKETFLTCQKGTIDFYIAFYELGMNMLKEEGELVFITPNSFMYNQSSGYFRDYVNEHLYLKKLINFNSTKVFDAATYNAIVQLKKSANLLFSYYEYLDEEIRFVDKLSTSWYKGKNWNFSSLENQVFIERHTNPEKSLGLCASVQYGFTTMRDKIYIAKEIEIVDDTYAYFNDMKVERELIKKIVKGSLFKNEEDYHYILTPYQEVSGRLKIIEESDFRRLYPLAYSYLYFHKEELLKRDMEKNLATWYQFGRSQGLNHMNKEKLVVKHIVKKENVGKIQVTLLPAETYVYSGIFITGENLLEIKEILESPDFYKYICLVGKDMSGGYKSISTKMIKSYSI